VVGRIQLFWREFERASWYFDRALALCPNDSELLVQLSICEVFMGRPDIALDHVERAMRLNPYYPSAWHGIAAFALLLLRRFDEAFTALERAGPIPIVDLPAYAAVALAQEGKRAGLLDAEIYVPSKPRMMGVCERPKSPDGKFIMPLHAHGVTLMSIGLMLKENEAVIWRGPMLMGALQQLVEIPGADRKRDREPDGGP